MGVLEFAQDHYGVGLTLASAVLMYLLNILLKYGGLAPAKVSQTYLETWTWSSYIVSLTHAAIVGISSLCCVLANRNLFYNFADNNDYEPAYWVICFSTGYFIYDLYDEIAHCKVSNATQYIIHHVLVLSILGQAVIYRQFIGIGITGLITEFHNVFLHSRIILGFYDWNKIPSLKNMFGFVNLVTCFICRLLLFPWIAYIVFRSSFSMPIVVLLYAELVYIYVYSLHIFKLSLETDFPEIRVKC